jgi:hypothetical protein
MPPREPNLLADTITAIARPVVDPLFDRLSQPGVYSPPDPTAWIRALVSNAMPTRPAEAATPAAVAPVSNGRPLSTINAAMPAGMVPKPVPNFFENFANTFWGGAPRASPSAGVRG